MANGTQFGFTKTLDHKVALLIDAPNMLYGDIVAIDRLIRPYGDVVVKEVFLTKGAPEGLIEFYIQRGYKPVIDVMKDVDTSLTTRAVEFICSRKFSNINLIAIGSMDGDYIPILHKAREYEKKSLIIGIESQPISQGLRNCANYYETISRRTNGLNGTNGVNGYESKRFETPGVPTFGC